MRKNLITAGLIAAAIALWLFSGVFFSDGDDGPANPPAPGAAETPRETSRQPIAVRARTSRAQPHTRTLSIRGRTENKRTVEVRTEITGRVVARPVERGDRVEAGDTLCRIAIDDREVAVEEARAGLARAEIEFEGAQRLQEKGLQSATAIAQARARLAAARATLERSRLQLARTELRAPFAGVVENVALDIGDYATPGSGCVTLLDLDPMLVTARVSPGDATLLTPGTRVDAVTATGRQLEATLTFVGNQSDAGTRTYAVEARVANPDYSLRSGVPTTLRIPVEDLMAHRVSSALFTLDDEGRLGLRVLEDGNRVAFRTVAIVDDTSEGTWVTGLPLETRIITVGQEFVFEGQRVRVREEDAKEITLSASVGS
jgi:multidrug efflux system membrane fusion protein